MQAHKRYLEQRLAQTEARPELHPHQRRALRELLTLARTGIEPLDYVARTRGLFVLSQAEYRDRHENRRRFWSAIGDDRLVWVAGQHAAAAGRATGPEDLPGHLWDAQQATSAVELAALASQAQVSRVVLALWRWGTAGTKRGRLVCRPLVEVTWRHLQANDPGITWERLCATPPYRAQLPFPDARLGRFGAWLEEAVGPTLTVVEPPPPIPLPPRPPAGTWGPPRMPSVAEAASGFHAAFEGLGDRPELAEVARVYERIFALERTAVTSTAFLAAVEEEDLSCEIARAWQRVRAADHLERARGASQPHLEAHAGLLRAAVDGAHSLAEIELEVLRHETCLRFEATWNRILLHVAFRPVICALALDFDGSEERRAELLASARATAELLGAAWGELFTVPRLWDFFAEFLFTRGQGLLDMTRRHPVVTSGEVGYGLLSGLGPDLLHATIAQVRARRGPAPFEQLRADAEARLDARRFFTPEQMRDQLSSRFAALTGTEAIPKGPASHRVLTLWGREVALEHVHEAVIHPDRPAP